MLRYGNARELCLGLEVVHGRGELWNGLRALRKDNTGYDLRDLFIGAEGTLGVITAAVLKLFPQPAAQVVAFVGRARAARGARLLQLAQARLGAALTAFELMSDTCIGPGANSTSRGTRCRWPSARRGTCCSSSQRHARTRRTPASHRRPARGRAGTGRWPTDAALSRSLAQFRALWALREDISESQGAEGKTIKHDIALPISRIADFIARTDAAHRARVPRRAAGGVRPPRRRQPALQRLAAGGPHRAGARGGASSRWKAPMNRLVHDAVVALGGSISAEHGLGVLRRDESARYKSPVELKLMRRSSRRSTR